MLRIYLLTLLRLAKKSKALTFMNLIGMTLSLAVFIVIVYHVQYEFNGDKFHTKYERLCSLDNVPLALPKMFGSSLPEINRVCRFSEMNSLFTSQDKTYLKPEHGFFADSTVFEVFTFEFLKGDPTTALQKPFSIVLSESSATVLFGAENPIGQSLKYRNEFEFHVTGVFKDLPSNSHLDFDLIAEINDMGRMSELEKYPFESFEQWGGVIYFELNKEVDMMAFSDKLYDLGKERSGNDENVNLRVQPFSEIYFDTENTRTTTRAKSVNKSLLYALISIGAFIIVISTINWINLTTSRASDRAAEIGIKKALGVSRRSLIWQFLMESVLFILIAGINALIFAQLMGPFYSQVTGISLNVLNFTTEHVLLYFFGLIVLGLLSGCYAAFYLSSFSPVKILKGDLLVTGRGVGRNVLVTIQFIITTILIVGAYTIYQQTHYVRNADLGLNKENLLYVEYNIHRDRSNLALFRNEVLQHPGILSASNTNTIPGEFVGQNWMEIDGEQKKLYDFRSDANVFETLGLRAVEGELPTKDTPKASYEGTIVLNQAAVAELGWDNPIGKTEIWGRPVAAVVENFHFNSLHEPIKPMMVRFNGYLDYMLVKVNANDFGETIDFIKSRWEAFYPDDVFEFHFVDDRLDQLYRSDVMFGKMINFFCLYAIIIGFIGLLGQVRYSMERKRKEMTVRKLLGASTNGIIWFFTKSFSRWLIVGNIIGFPLALLIMQKWLSNFAYRIDIPNWLLALIVLFTITVAILTITGQTRRLGRSNLAQVLRNE